MKKKYIVTGIIILLVIPLVIIFQRNKQIQTVQNSTNRKASQPTFTIDQTSYSPSSQNAITHGEVLLESVPSDETTIQKFVVKSSVDEKERNIFMTNQPGLTFEKMTPSNWSPTNRFLFIYADYDGKRDLLFLKTDGRFTDAQYFLHSTGLYPDLTITSAQWIDTAALKVQGINMKTHISGNYVVDFDDDTGAMMPASVYNEYYKDD